MNFDCPRCKAPLQADPAPGETVVCPTCHCQFLPSVQEAEEPQPRRKKRAATKPKDEEKGDPLAILAGVLAFTWGFIAFTGCLGSLVQAILLKDRFWSMYVLSGGLLIVTYSLTQLYHVLRGQRDPQE